MSDEIMLDDHAIEQAITSKMHKVPPETGIIRGARFSLSTKVGGRMQLVQVVCKGAPYEHVLSNGKKALYVDVFGYGVSKKVNVKKLLQMTEVG